MKIASIDYGLNTGLVLGEIQVKKKKVVLSGIVSMTIYDDILQVVELIETYKCISIVLEQCPTLSTGAAREPFDKICMKLKEKGWLRGNSIREKHRVKHIGPGLWKPFMKKQQTDLSILELHTVHEKDAMKMLWYAVQIAWKDKKVVLHV